MAKQFLIGDDGVVQWNDIEITSAQSVSFGDSRTDITSNSRGNDRTQHRVGKRDSTFTLNVRVEPNDDGLAALLYSYNNAERGVLNVTDGEDTLEEASYVVLDAGGEQPLEDEQTYSIELAYHSGETTTGSTPS